MNTRKKPVKRTQLGFTIKQKVLNCLKNGKWWSLDNLSVAIGGAKHSTITSRIRDLRLKQYGGHNIKKRFIQQHTAQYKLIKTRRAKS